MTTEVAPTRGVRPDAPAPSLELPLAGGGTFRLADAAPRLFTMLVFQSRAALPAVPGTALRGRSPLRRARREGNRCCLGQRRERAARQPDARGVEDRQGPAGLWPERGADARVVSVRLPRDQR